MGMKENFKDIYLSLIDRKDSIEHDLQLAQDYAHILEEARDENSPNYFCGDFVNRGVVMCCANPKKGILITGINPSQRGESKDTFFYTFKDTMSDPERRKGSYWRNKHSQLIGDDEFLLNHTAYLDLFPFVESSQNKFSKEVEGKIDFQVRTLLVTFAEIEKNICPKLIIAANNKSSYYWGVDKKHPWMGYALEKVNEIPPCLKGLSIRLYQIKSKTGFVDSDKRVKQEMESLQDFKESSLNGTYFVDYAMYDERHKDELKLRPQIVRELFHWIEERIASNK